MTDEEIEVLWKQFTDLLRSTNRQGVENVIKWLEETDFKTAPASSQYHNAFRGGLLQHSLNVYNATFDFPLWIEFMDLKQDTLILTSLLHDVCKADCYIVSSRNKKDENGNWVTVPFYQYEEALPWGHGDKSVILLLQKGLILDNVEISMIRNHMGFTGSDDERRVGRLFRICPQSMLLHLADMEATSILESFDGPQRYIDKIRGNKNITEWKQNLNKPKMVKSGTMEYELARDDEIVDWERVIEVKCDDGLTHKVYSPYEDGLPF